MGDGAGRGDRARRAAAGAGAPTAICTTTRSRASHPLWCGPLGYQGSKAAMKLIAQGRRRAGARHAARAVRHAAAARPRLLAEGREDHPDRRRSRRCSGLVKPISVGICGDAEGGGARAASRGSQARTLACHANQRRAPRRHRGGEGRVGDASSTAGRTRRTRGRSRWRRTRRTCTRARCCASSSARCRTDAMVSTDIGNICSVSNSYLRFERPRSMFAAMSFGNCGYAFPTIVGAKVAAPDRPAIAYVGDGAWGMSFGEMQTCVRENIPVTAVVFNNGQWGAEKKNHVDFYDNRFVGVNLDNQPSWAAVAQGDGRRRHRDREAVRRRAGAARGGGGAERGQDDGARDDGHARAGRSVPPRRAGAAGAPSRQVQVDGGKRDALRGDATRRARSLLVVAAVLCVGEAARVAQDYPNKPIRMIVPYPPARRHRHRRAHRQRAAGHAALGQPIIIDNKRRRRRQPRHRHRREGAARRLHDPVHAVVAHDQSQALRQAAVRRREGFRADEPRGVRSRRSSS